MISIRRKMKDIPKVYDSGSDVLEESVDEGRNNIALRMEKE